MPKEKISRKEKPQANLFGLLKPYRGYIFLLIAIALVTNGISLWVPLILSQGIDGFLRGSSSQTIIVWELAIASLGTFIFTYLQSVAQTYTSERVARDMRKNLSAKIAEHSYAFVEKVSPSKLLTNLTSDIDNVKNFVGQAVVSIISSVFVIIGAAILLVSINWRLGLAVLTVVPVIAVTFYLVLSRVRALFLKTREVIDWLNKVINESILGAALIRVLDSEEPESAKFVLANNRARDLGLQILRLFSFMIPVIIFVSNMAVIIILVLGGHYVITGTMSLGNIAAFTSYLAILIFPILIIGFMSNIIAQAQASYGRVAEILTAPEVEKRGTNRSPLAGNITLEHVTLRYGEKYALSDVSLKVAPGTRTAIIGPTAAGKTQLLNLLIGLVAPTSGKILYDGIDILDYEEEALHRQIGFVFQDSIIFNMSLRENIAFNTKVSKADMEKAMATAELDDFVGSLPAGLETIVSERGTSLSGGQKQRVMLARALALDPKILLLDDFTARVDVETERMILGNVQKNYPGITLVSVTQKVAAVENYDQIIVLMEGELIAAGKHLDLLSSSPEYAQIYESQQSTNAFERT